MALLRLLGEASAWSFTQSARQVDIYRSSAPSLTHSQAHTQTPMPTEQVEHPLPLPSPVPSSDPSFCPAFLGVGVLHCSPLVVLDYLSDTQKKREYDEVRAAAATQPPASTPAHTLHTLSSLCGCADPLLCVVYDEIFDGSSTVYRVSTVTSVELHSYWTPSRLLIAARDLCLLGHAAMLSDGALLLCARSVAFASGGEPRAAYTRAHLHCGGFVMQALDNVGRTLPMNAVNDYEGAIAALISARLTRLTFVAHCDLRGSLPHALRSKLLHRQPLSIHRIRHACQSAQPSAALLEVHAQPYPLRTPPPLLRLPVALSPPPALPLYAVSACSVCACAAVCSRSFVCSLCTPRCRTSTAISGCRTGKEERSAITATEAGREERREGNEQTDSH